jgi:ZIP family zinc transporter
MSNTIIYGLISVSPLFIGALIGSYFHIKTKWVGAISAFGAGALVAALTFGLMEESFRLGGLDSSIIGFVIGGLTFVIGDLIIIRVGGRGHKKFYKAESSSGWGIVLGAVLDGIPESIALGIGLLLNPKIGLLVLIGIIASNLPEAISSAHDLRHIGKPVKTILGTWLAVALVSLIFVVLGYTIFAGIPSSTTAIFESIAAGAILTMLASTMMPEAYKEGGVGSSLATVCGFLIIFIISKLGV